MKKLTLDLAALTVQSFATDDEALLPFGTVHARVQGTGPQDTECSCVDACPSSRGCSDVSPCRPTQGDNCPSAALDCPTSRGCSEGIKCDPSRGQPCASARECSEFDCPEQA